MLNEKKINKDSQKKRVLIAPLDWGLGHATRCIPIINQLLLTGIDVLIAGERATVSLLKKEFPNAFFLPLKGYRIKYSRKKSLLPLKLLLQLPMFFFAVYKEHQWLKKAIIKYELDAVISDNRLGLYSKKIPCVYITHQLLIKTGNFFTQKIAQHIHYFFIKKYIECWLPDNKDLPLAGELSHPLKLPRKIKYIGILSRFETVKDIIKEYDLLIVISGPEPQRTILENILFNEVKNFDGKFLFIRGLPGTEKQPELKPKSGIIINHLSGKQLSEAIQKSKIVITRAGYTTIMDLIKLQQKAILIPTPGQTEQEYLASYLMNEEIFYAVEQNNFSLSKSLKEALAFPFNIPLYDMFQYRIIVNNFIHSL